MTNRPKAMPAIDHEHLGRLLGLVALALSHGLVACQESQPEKIEDSLSLTFQIDQPGFLESDASLLIDFLKSTANKDGSEIALRFENPNETCILRFKVAPPPPIGCYGFIQLSEDQWVKDDEIVDDSALTDFLSRYREMSELVGSEPFIHFDIKPGTPLSRLLEFARISAIAEYPQHILTPVHSQVDE